MTDEEESESGEEKSFRERVEEIRQQRAEEGDGEGDGEGLSREEKMQEMMGGGGGPGGMGGGGGMGGSPFAQMMGGMMGGGGPGAGAGGPPGMGGSPEGESSDNEELVREVRKVRDELHDIRREMERVADALEER